MSEENVFNSLRSISWGKKYEKVLALCEENKCLEIIQTNKNSSIHVRGKCEGNEFKARFIFGNLFKKLKQINIAMIFNDIEEKENDTTQISIDKFLQTYYILVEKLGKASSESGMSLDKFKDMDYLGNTNLEDLPYFEWNNKRTLIKHRFIEKEGFEILTTLEPKK